MGNKEIWEKEYASKNLMRGDKPQKSLLNFLKFYKKIKKNEGIEFPFENINVLDLGSGEGKNSIYLAELGAKVYGIEIAENAVVRSNLKIYKEIESNVSFSNGSIGEHFNFDDNIFDIVIDVTSSNSLNESERDIMLSEISRVLKPEGFLF